MLVDPEILFRFRGIKSNLRYPAINDVLDERLEALGIHINNPLLWTTMSNDEVMGLQIGVDFIRFKLHNQVR